MNPTQNLSDVIGRIERQLKAPVAQRDKFERDLIRRLGKAWEGELTELMKYVGDPPSLSNVPESYWNNGGKKLRQAIQPILESVFIEQAASVARSVNLTIDWMLVNEQAVNWASEYAGKLITKITETNRKLVNEYVQRYYRDSWTIDDLVDKLSVMFSKERARIIAITETTNAATQSELSTINYLEGQYNLRYDGYWLTANDDRVCDYCGPRHDKLIDDGEYPPAHVNCRCEVRFELHKDEA